MNADDTVLVDEEWIEKDGKAYRRIRFAGEEWSAWEQMDQFPWLMVTPIETSLL